MKFPAPVSIDWIAKLINADIIGNNHGEATGINEIHKVEEGDLVFVDHPKYYDQCINSAATYIIINKHTEFPEGKSLLITTNPFEAYCTIVNHFKPFVPQEKNISDTATIGEGSYVYPNSFVGHRVQIGKDCIIYPNVTIMNDCIIGDHVILHPGTVIGSDAYYYNTKKDRDVWYRKMPSGGRVILEDFVEIGAGCTIDRGVSHDTIIGRGTKLDNTVHIGHDTVIGKNCLVGAHVVIAGYVNVLDGVTLWGQTVVNKTLTIGENAVLLGRTGVSGDLPGNKTYWGAPAQEASIVKRELVWIKRIPLLWDKVMGK